MGVLWWAEECVVKENFAINKIFILDKEENMHRYLTVYGPTGLTAFLSIK